MSTYASLNAHLVFATKERRPMISESWQSEMHSYLAGAIKGQGAIPLAVGGTADHVHLLIGYRPSLALAELVREIKKSSNQFGKQQLRDFAWQEGYAVFSVDPGRLGGLKTYIANQRQHHGVISSRDELRKLLGSLKFRSTNGTFSESYRTTPGRVCRPGANSSDAFGVGDREPGKASSATTNQWVGVDRDRTTSHRVTSRDPTN